ncbi:MAG TPA: hypothetical protein ENN39_02645 [Desulfonatronum sp.]|nr:hypothetical protein [Desulfonatronum sp.]
MSANNPAKIFEAAWNEANLDIPPEEAALTDQAVLEHIAFAPESLEHSEIRERVYAWSWRLRNDPKDKEAAGLVRKLGDALAGKLKRRGQPPLLLPGELARLKLLVRLAHDCLLPWYEEMRAGQASAKRTEGADRIFHERAVDSVPSYIRAIRPHGEGFYSILTEARRLPELTLAEFIKDCLLIHLETYPRFADLQEKWDGRKDEPRQVCFKEHIPRIFKDALHPEATFQHGPLIVGAKAQSQGHPYFFLR